MRKGHLLLETETQQKHVTLSTSPIRQALEDFLLSREAMRCTPATLDFYRFTAAAFVSWLELKNLTHPEEVKSSHVREWLAGMPKAKDTTLHAKARGVRTLLRFWLAEKYLPEAVTFQMPRLEKKRLPYLSPEQFKKALKAATTARDRAILLFVVDSGIRRAEMLALNWGDVNFQTGAIIIRKGKGNKARVSAIGAHTRRALISYRRSRNAGDGDPLFQTDEGMRLSAMGLRSIFQRLGKRAGFKISPHMLRRTCAVQFLREHGDVIALQALLGHADVSMTAHYCALLSDDVLSEHRQHGADSWL
jgi:site-specific recombinase XerD